MITISKNLTDYLVTYSAFITNITEISQNSTKNPPKSQTTKFHNLTKSTTYSPNTSTNTSLSTLPNNKKSTIINNTSFITFEIKNTTPELPFVYHTTGKIGKF